MPPSKGQKKTLIMLFRLAYDSTNLIKRSTGPRLSELRKLILSAGSNNRERRITGVSLLIEMGSRRAGHAYC